jgi:hypothetical protein
MRAPNNRNGRAGAAGSRADLVCLAYPGRPADPRASVARRTQGQHEVGRFRSRTSPVAFTANVDVAPERDRVALCEHLDRARRASRVPMRTPNTQSVAALVAGDWNDVRAICVHHIDSDLARTLADKCYPTAIQRPSGILIALSCHELLNRFHLDAPTSPPTGRYPPGPVTVAWPPTTGSQQRRPWPSAWPPTGLAPRRAGLRASAG